MDFPKVSIITSMYNPTREDFLKTSESVLNQSNDDFEWIVVDDGSSNGHNFRYDIRLKNNYGPSVARNVAFQASQGKYITYLDIGDTISKRRVDHIIEIFESFNTELLFDGYYIYENNKAIFYNPLFYNDKNVAHIGSKISERSRHLATDSIHTLEGSTYFFSGIVGYLQGRNVSIPLGVSHTRKVFVDAGMFQPGIVCGEDGILWRRMSEQIDPHKIILTDFDAGSYFVNLGGQSRTQRRFDMGGFAFHAGNEHGSHGQYLDDDWFNTYLSVNNYD